jgi:hypothetical protein
MILSKGSFVTRSLFPVLEIPSLMPRRLRILGYSVRTEVLSLQSEEFVSHNKTCDHFSDAARKTDGLYIEYLLTSILDCRNPPCSQHEHNHNHHDHTSGRDTPGIQGQQRGRQ